jgi:hypothetical protein
VVPKLTITDITWLCLTLLFTGGGGGCFSMIFLVGQLDGDVISLTMRHRKGIVAFLTIILNK